MPGLIYSNDYSAHKDPLCAANSWVEAAIDALEWELMRAATHTHYTFIGPSWGRIFYSHSSLATAFAPRVIVVFSCYERQGGEDKVVMEDVK